MFQAILPCPLWPSSTNSHPQSVLHLRELGLKQRLFFIGEKKNVIMGMQRDVSGNELC